MTSSTIIDDIKTHYENWLLLPVPPDMEGQDLDRYVRKYFKSNLFWSEESKHDKISILFEECGIMAIELFNKTSTINASPLRKYLLTISQLNFALYYYTISNFRQVQDILINLNNPQW